MDISPIGRAALKAREGERLTAYRDSVGVWTISVGITTASGLIVVKPGLTITQAQSDVLFAKAVEKYVDPVRKALGGKPCTQEQFDAFVSICYNIGPGNFAHAGFLRKFMAGDVAGAAAAILAWNKPAAVISRRQGEYDQFRTPYSKALPKARRGDYAPVKAPKGPVPVVPKAPDPMAPITAPATPPKSDANIPVSNHPAEPAPSGGLLRSGTEATGAAARNGLAWLFDLIRNALSRKA